MGHYDCRYCGETMGDKCCPQSILEDQFSNINKNIYSRAKNEAEMYFATPIKRKQDELYNKYKWTLVGELYRRYLKANIKLKSEKAYGRYRIYAFVEGQETYLFEL